MQEVYSKGKINRRIICTLGATRAKVGTGDEVSVVMGGKEEIASTFASGELAGLGTFAIGLGGAVSVFFLKRGAGFGELESLKRFGVET